MLDSILRYSRAKKEHQFGNRAKSSSLWKGFENEMQVRGRKKLLLERRVNFSSLLAVLIESKLSNLF